MAWFEDDIGDLTLQQQIANVVGGTGIMVLFCLTALPLLNRTREAARKRIAPAGPTPEPDQPHGSSG